MVKTKTKRKKLPKQSEYDKVIDALNLIDEHAEPHDDYDQAKERFKAYEIVANFIDKKAKRN